MKKIALAGNPNSGKTSIFNSLTGAKQHVGNWPGVTVEKKMGKLKYKEAELNVVDLPGTYSLGAYSEDEIIGRNYILSKDADLIVNVLDSTNIERNLYLTTQLLELGYKVVVALNMIDEADTQGIKIDIKKLSEKLGTSVVAVSALKHQNIAKLIEETIKIGQEQREITLNLIDYGIEINKEIENLDNLINAKDIEYPSKWVALKLLEDDAYINNYVKNKGITGIDNAIKTSMATIEEEIGLEPDMAIVDKRYSLIASYTKDTVSKKQSTEDDLTTKLDRIFTNKFLGIPIFLGVMYLLYNLTFTIGAGLQGYADELIAGIGESTVIWLEGIGAPNMLTSFIGGGVFSGVGAVISFLPLIMVMYFLMGLLEDSGYMARAAYVMDRVMRALGLHGKTFVSMLIGVGCNVPAIMATRTLENKKDRMIALLINPFISCGARLPIYLVFIDAFFTDNKALILFSLYVTGAIIALIVGKVFSKTLFKGEQSYFVMELPKYRMPSIKNVTLLMLNKAGSFFKKAGVIILPMMMLLWILSNFPFGVEEFSSESLLGQIGSIIAPIFAPAGFGTWEAGVSIFTGILAKETVVATMGMLYGGVTEGVALTTAIQSVFTPLTAMSFMIFSLLYTPCLVALGAIKRETNTKWMLFSASYTFAIAWIASVLVYQVGRLMGF